MTSWCSIYTDASGLLTRDAGLQHQTMKKQLAALLKVKVEDLSLAPIDTGLTHKTFQCSVANDLYFVKYYNPAPDVQNQITQINQLMQFMRKRGIPAPRVIAYSAASPRLVVHEYVQGSCVVGDADELQSIAKLYSRLAAIGLEKPYHVKPADYLQHLERNRSRLENIKETSLVCKRLHQQYLTTFGQVIDILRTDLNEQALLHINIHDDFTEKNLLMQNGNVQLLCDWDSYRLKYFLEHFSCSMMRFATDAPLSGGLSKSKLQQFRKAVEPEVLTVIDSAQNSSSLIPVLATLKHLRTYGFRNSVVKNMRPDLEESLLYWPVRHCQALVEQRRNISDLILACS